jgi:hypothetical protein
VHDPRICGENAGDVGPDLDALGVDGGAEQRGGVVAAAPT